MIQYLRRDPKAAMLGNCLGHRLRSETYQRARAALLIAPVARLLLLKQRGMLQRLQELFHQAGFELVRCRVQFRVIGIECRVLSGSRIDAIDSHYMTSNSASSAWACFIACNMEIMSRAVAPICCRLSTNSSTVAPSRRSIRFAGLSCAWTVVCRTT